MARLETWRVVSAFVALLVVVTLLLSTPSMIFAQSLAIVDTELREAERPQRVLTKFDLGDAERLHALPTTLGPWTMTLQHEWDAVADVLDTDVLLSRDYARRDLYQGANLLIVQSTNVSSFHPAPLCYRVQGWDVEDEGRPRDVYVPNGSWAQKAWLSEEEPNVFSGNVSAKLLEATRERPDGGREKRVALYLYLKKEDWRVTQEVTWVRAEIAVPPTTPASQVAPILGDLLAEALPHIFSFDKGDEPTLGEEVVTRAGLLGVGLIAAAFAAPILFATAPLLRKGALRPTAPQDSDK